MHFVTVNLVGYCQSRQHFYWLMVCAGTLKVRIYDRSYLADDPVKSMISYFTGLV